MVAEGIRGVTLVPIPGPNAALGALAFYYDVPKHLSPEDIQILEIVAMDVGSALAHRSRNPGLMAGRKSFLP